MSRPLVDGERAEMRNNPGFNTWNIPGHVYNRAGWSANESKMYNDIGQRNRRREGRLTEEQAENYHRMTHYWLERGSYYQNTTNYPDDLCDVLACQDVLNVVTATPKQE